MSLAVLIPIGFAALIVWHEWNQRKLPWPTTARERSEHSSPRQVEREGSRDEPSPTPDDAGGGG